ncbi:hypothetical protein Ocin01_03865 [Orchesella cincta]|uniref:Uncharacterized protein n=1 Tax=Orchesella cincta TaxID=48709 RepID=A0A1D2NC05_ORCCI|nr:hypothetical protein Ocin01_03865 [Orchesella cincta]
MSDSETALAVAAAIAALRDDEDEEMTQVVSQSTMPPPAVPGSTAEEGEGSKAAEEPEQVVEKPKPKLKVMSCLICTTPITTENTQMGSSNPSEEYERMMRVACRLLCVDNHPLLKRWKFRHSEEPKKLCCDACCEVIFNLGSLQSIIDRTRLAINKKLDWILKTVSDSAAEESDEIEKVFFAGRSDIFRSEVLEVCKRKKNAKNGLADDSDEEEELVNSSTQTDVSGDSGVNDVRTKAGLKFFDERPERPERPSYSFDDASMDTYSDHNDDMSFSNTYDNDKDDTTTSFSTPKSEPPKRANAKKTPASTSSSSSSKQPSKRGRPSKRPAKYDEFSDDDIEILEEKKTNKPKGRGQPPAKSSRMDARELVKVEYNSDAMAGRPKRSTAAKRPNYQVLAGDDDDEYSSGYKRSSSGTDYLSKNKKPATGRKEVTLSAIPIVKDASGKTYFEGVEIVRTEKSITCKHLGCYYVVDGSGYNAFERIKAHIHETHIGEGALPDIY